MLCLYLIALVSHVESCMNLLRAARENLFALVLKGLIKAAILPGRRDGGLVEAGYGSKGKVGIGELVAVRGGSPCLHNSLCNLSLIQWVTHLVLRGIFA